jgi:hypothetical protein
LLSQRKLPFQISDLAIAPRQFFAEPLILSRQSLDFLRLTAIAVGGLLLSLFVWRPSRPRGTHAPYVTLILSACTA